MYPIFHPVYMYIKLFIMHFLCIHAVRPCRIQEVIYLSYLQNYFWKCGPASSIVRLRMK